MGTQSVGRSAVFVAKSRGAFVIAAVRSKDLEEARELGADLLFVEMATAFRDGKLKIPYGPRFPLAEAAAAHAALEGGEAKGKVLLTTREG